MPPDRPDAPSGTGPETVPGIGPPITGPDLSFPPTFFSALAVPHVICFGGGRRGELDIDRRLVMPTGRGDAPCIGDDPCTAGGGGGGGGDGIDVCFTVVASPPVLGVGCLEEAAAKAFASGSIRGGGGERVIPPRSITPLSVGGATGGGGGGRRRAPGTTIGDSCTCSAEGANAVPS